MSEHQACHIVIPLEIQPEEQRVAATPASVTKLIALGYSVSVQANAGVKANFVDAEYQDVGATIVKETKDLYQTANIVLKIQAPTNEEIELLSNGTTLICHLWPAQNAQLLELLAQKQINALSVDSIPRTSRAQKMDVLSSMANIAGYRAVVEAASQFGRFFTGQVTAAGKIPPAKVLVIGAGVAGLAAIGAAKSMGAIVRAFDTRPEVEDQITSMGAEFLVLDFEEDGAGSGGYAKQMSQEFIDAEMALFAEQAKDVDIIITTANIPGKKAPVLVTEAMVQSMKNGSIIVDLASENGGNCECTVPGEVSNKHGVTLIGYKNIPARIPNQSSQLFANNLVNLLTDMTEKEDKKFVHDMDDVVIRGATVVFDKKITWPPPPLEVSAAPAQPAKKPEPVKTEPKEVKDNTWQIIIFWLVAGAGLLGLGKVAPAEFMAHFTVFTLACFVGWQVIWNVSHSLHTPLMAVTNAISGIVIVGSLLQVTGSGSVIVTIMAFIAILMASINIFGGFFVTHRMLKMFRK